jgi:hypothetical protein
VNLFFSYARDDQVYAHKLAEALRDEARHQVWEQRRAASNARGWALVLDQVEACDCFIFILTPRATVSAYCLAALEYAIQLGKPILALMLRLCEVPRLLRGVPLEHVGGSLAETQLQVERALSRIQVSRYQGAYPAPESKPERPPQPRPQPDDPDYVFEQFAAAEEAASGGNNDLAERLYQKVVESDPIGLGALASSRLEELRHLRAQRIAYERIEKLVANPETMENAKAAWRMYLARYGRVYDPHNFTDLLTDRAAKTAPLNLRDLKDSS